MSTPSPSSGGRLAAVGGGAAVGALARAAAGVAWPVSGDDLPVTTLLVNVVGCLVIGLVTPGLRRYHPLLGLALSTGVLGGFTTFSTFAVDLERLAGPAPATAAAYLALTVVGCVGAAAAGLVAGERLSVRGRR